MKQLGKPVICNECGGEVYLYAQGNELYSRCSRCGFSECEWRFGDNPDYLNYLSERYKISSTEIFNSVKGSVPTNIQKTIVEQLSMFNPLFLIDYSIKAILWNDDGRSVRFHVRKKRKIINIDVIYDAGSDLYNIKAYKVEGLDCKEIFNGKGFYFDQLDEIFSSIVYGKRGGME